MALEGRTALVVGFAGAIGSTIAISLAIVGCDVIGVDKAKQDTVQISIDKIKEKYVKRKLKNLNQNKYILFDKQLKQQFSINC